MNIPLGLGWFAGAGIGIFGLAIIICWIIGLVDVSRRPDLERDNRFRWILLIVLLPIVGTIIYWVKRPILPDEAEKIISARGLGPR